MQFLTPQSVSLRKECSVGASPPENVVVTPRHHDVNSRDLGAHATATYCAPVTLTGFGLLGVCPPRVPLRFTRG